MTVSITVPESEPASIRAGDTLTWKKSLADYPASAGWSLAYVLINGTAKVSISSTASGNDHLVEVSAATTAGYTAGDYGWSSYVTKGSERYFVDTGFLTVLPNLVSTSVTTYDSRTHARIVLDAIEAAIESRASGDQLDVLITLFGDKSVTRDRGYLIKMRGYYRAEVRAEEAAAGRGTTRRILQRFA